MKDRTDAQIRRRLHELRQRLAHERSNVSAKLMADGYSQAAADYFTTEAQTAPKKVLNEIGKDAASPKLAGSVKRCVNLIKSLNGKYWQFRREAKRRGLQV